MSEGRKPTPVPIREREAQSVGSGPVITYKLSPEELEHYIKTGKIERKDRAMNQLTKEQYLQMRLKGIGRTAIMKEYFKGQTTPFYRQLDEWGIREKDAEDQALDLFAFSVKSENQNPKEDEAAKDIAPQQEQPTKPSSLAEQIEKLILQHAEKDNVTEKIKQWAKDRGLDTADPAKQILKLGEEYGELCRSLAVKNTPQVIDAIGDIYVVLTVLSLQLGLDIDDCINQAYEEIKNRKGKIINGVFVKDADITA